MSTATNRNLTRGRRSTEERLARFLLLVVVALILSGCASLLDSDQVGTDPAAKIALEAGAPAGQT